jgi:hypothetical protein
MQVFFRVLKPQAVGAARFATLIFLSGKNPSSQLNVDFQSATSG